MRERTVAGNVFSKRHLFLKRESFKKLLNALVHPAKPCLKRQYFLARDTEAEISRLYDASVHWPYWYLVDALAANLIESVRAMFFLFKPGIPWEVFTEWRFFQGPVLFVHDKRAWVR